jgi:hypothetical protein
VPIRNLNHDKEDYFQKYRNEKKVTYFPIVDNQIFFNANLDVGKRI